VSLFWRVFSANAAVFVVATAILAFSPATVSSPLDGAREALVLAVGLSAILLANVFLLRLSFAPLARLIAVMQRIDLLNREERLPPSGTAEVTDVIEAFNEMLDRLEAERRASTARVLAGQESERRRIAQELHDEIGQGLTAVLLQLRRTASRAPDVRDELAEAQATARATLDDVRGIAHRLRPGVLDDLGLVRALTALTNAFSERTGIAVERRFDGEIMDLTREEELAVYRVAQESLTNVMRHAGASRVLVALAGTSDDVLLRVEDDGAGVHDGEVRGGGIRGMRERALAVGGRLSVGVSDLGGTEVILRFPVTSNGR
jgi:two-component system, NarL family, sensor histidine kinase UhpB